MINLRSYCVSKVIRTYCRTLKCENNLHDFLNKKPQKQGCGTRLCSTNVDLKIEHLSLNNYIKKLEKEYRELSNQKKSSAVVRIAQLQPVVTLLGKRKTLVEYLVNLKELLNDSDKDIKALAEEEKQKYKEDIKALDKELLEAILPGDEEDNVSSIVLEVNAGVGGQEAMLFAKELFDMYSAFADYKGWQFEIAEYLTTDIGGVRHASALMNGTSVLRYFKYEAGVHRVQRIPTTEKAGRVHTSTVSVLALPQPTDIQISLEPKDLKIETKRASGAGGQHVNTTDSAVRIVHLPTNTSVECQVGRSQIKNREIAMTKLRALLYQKELDSQLAQTVATKKSQVRTNFRNEKIRTYNFSQDRITDHRLQSSNVHNIKVFLEGGAPLEGLINKLDNHFRKERLLEMVREAENK